MPQEKLKGRFATWMMSADVESPMLNRCEAFAAEVERHASALDAGWDGLPLLLRKTGAFRRSCRELASNRGLEQITIAFTGPKNAGKTQLLSLLLESTEKRQALQIGQASSQGTARVTWLASERPEPLHEAFEEYIPCRDEELAPLGFSCALVDVPGLDELHAERRLAAERALDNALLKVLVVPQRELEKRSVQDYLRHSDGATILPVINLVREKERAEEDARGWQQLLQERLPHASVLEPVCIPDWDLEGNASARDEAGRLLREALRAAGAGAAAADLPEAELAQKLKRFQKDVAELAGERLPSTHDAADKLLQAEKQLPQQTLDQLLGPDAMVSAGLRQRLRATLLERTPYLFFPWRTALAAAHFVHGATDRLPLALMGSVPSLLTAAATAARNVRDAGKFASETGSGIRQRMESAVREQVQPAVRDLQFALNAETAAAGRAADEPSLNIGITGIEHLQAASTRIFESVVDRRAPGRAAAILWALLGCLVFWGIFAWPVWQLYADYYVASNATLQGVPPAFPEPSFGMLMTSLALGLLPMFLLLLVMLSLLLRRGKLQRAAEDVRDQHQAAVQKLSKDGLLTIRVENAQIRACLFFFRLQQERR